MKNQILHINALASMSWHAQAKLAPRLKDGTLGIQSRAGHCYKCKRFFNGIIEITNGTSHALTRSLKDALLFIELIDRLNAPMRTKVSA